MKEETKKGINKGWFKKGHKQFNTGRTHFKKGRKIPEETKRKIWKAVLESGRAFRKDNQLTKGRKHTEKSRKLMSSIHKGEKGSNWRGGLTLLKNIIRKCFEYRQWRSDVFTRDDFICRDCGIRSGRIIADHIKAFSLILEENKITTLEEAINCEELWNINNGRTLCQKCHEKTENFGGRSNKKTCYR